MSAGAHLSRSLANLIRTIGQTRSKEQEDEIIQSEIQMLKVNLSLNPKDSDLFELMIKLLYIETLGHDGSFAHIYPVNLCQSKNMKLKRLGYLLTTLCINRNSKLSIMTLATIQKDLTSGNLHNIMHCLTALPKILNKTIIEGSLKLIVPLLKHTTDLVRKKALIVIQKIHELDPTQVQNYKTHLQQALHDEQPPVVFIAVTLIKRLIQRDPEPYKQLTDHLCKILRDIVLHKYPKEYEYHKVPAPWIQLDILKILAMLGRSDAKTSAKIYDVVEKALRKSTYYQMHINNAIVIQSIKTVCQLYPNPGLIRQCQQYLFRFFQKDNHNLKSFGISCLKSLVAVEPSTIKNWQMQVLECLDTDDTTLATGTVELLIQIANEQNTQTIVSKLISLAEKETDRLFQLNLIKKSLLLIERFASSAEEYIRLMNELFEKFEDLLDQRSVNNYIEVLVESCGSNSTLVSPLIQEYSKMIQNTMNVHVIKVGAWLIGQYSTVIEDLESIEELTLLLIDVCLKSTQKHTIVRWIVPAIMKMSHTEGFRKHEQVKNFLLELENSRNIRTHNTAEEFIRLAKFAPALKNSKTLIIEKNPQFLADYAMDHEAPALVKKGSNKLPIKTGKQQKQLNLQPYKQSPVKKYQPAESIVKDDTVAIVELQQESILQFNGPRKWTNEGYQGKVPQVKPAPPPTVFVSQKQPEGAFRPKGPQDRKFQGPPASSKQDIRKINLAKSIFTGKMAVSAIKSQK